MNKYRHFNPDMNHKKLYIKYTILIFLVIALLFITSFTFLNLKTIEIQKNEIMKAERNIVSLERDVLENNVNDIISDLLYLAEIFKIHAENEMGLNEIAEEWLVFSEKKRIYDQIRYIDRDGNEKIRINLLKNQAYVVPSSEHQNKRSRYYFKDAIQLEDGQVYISKLDLNIENHQIEQPIKPMIRFATPYYDAEGSRQGVIVINYLAQHTIDKFEKIIQEKQGHIFLLNSDGYWLFNEDKSKEWAFMYEDKKEISFKNQYPEEWKALTDQEKGQFFSAKGLFTFSDIVLLKNNIYRSDIIFDEEYWKVVSHIENNNANRHVIDNNFSNVFIYSIKKNGIYFLWIGIISFLIAVLWVNNKISKANIKYYSEYDAMTNVFNRRAGMNRIQESYKKAYREEEPLSICFIDINGLKEVNDVLGHKYGDELITTVVRILKEEVRESDYIIRLGGDEFLIVFPNVNAKETEKIWGRIKAKYNKINEEEGRRYLVSVSHGVAEVDLRDTSHIDKLVHEADEKMYEEKREIKSNISIIRL